MALTRKPIFNLILRAGVSLASIYLMTFSYALFFKANLGSDSVTLLVDGLSQVFRIEYGTASNLVNALLFGIILVFNREIIGFSTVCSALLTGTFLQCNVNMLSSLWHEGAYPMWLRVLLPLVACVINAASIGAYLAMQLGASAFDGVVLTLSKGAMFNYKTAMYTVNITMFIVGVLCGGVWGYGTLVAVLSSGFLFEKMVTLMQRHLGVLVAKENETHEV